MAKSQRLDLRLLDYLKLVYPNVQVKLYKRQWMQFVASGTLLYVNASEKPARKGTGWYDLEEATYEMLTENKYSFQAILFANPETTFVLPNSIVRNIFDKQRKVDSEGKRPRWEFYVTKKDNRYILSIRGTRHDITDCLNNWDQIEDFRNKGIVNPGLNSEQTQYFLVQVNKPGSENVINNLSYSHYDWDKKPHDRDHGKVREGDILLFYFARGSIQYKMQLKKIYRVKTVSDHNRTFNLAEERELNGLVLEDIRNAINGKKLRSEIFGKLSQQGFNIARMERSDYDSVISLDEEKKRENNVTINDTQSLQRNWLSLSNKEITQIVEQVLSGQDKKLEIEDSVIRRIISHLILSKHVILVGPPGTGKTDLARRLLRELGKVLLGKSEPIERVASYEWGRYEVIGGTSISPDSEGDSFHLGCVTHAIKEGKLLLIDEFNRADMNKAFGEMFLAIDHGVIQLKENENPLGFIYKSSNEIEIPSNFRMICTMNDYDKSLLNELSYGLLRRFAFVEIEVPKDKKKVMEIAIERAKWDLREVDAHELQGSVSSTGDQIDKFIDFLLAIREKRQIGISSYIDVIRYVLFGVSITDDNPWRIMNDALIDYIIPQFDRLDFETIDFAYKSAIATFKDEKGIIPDLQPFLSTLHEKVKILQDLNKLFSSGDTNQ